MPDILALEFDKQKILGIEAQVTASSVRIHRHFELEIPDSIDPANDPKIAGEWLKEQLTAQGVKSTQVVATFPREIAVVRLIEMPDVPDENLPDLVKYQIGMKSSLPLTQLALDFLPLPKRGDASAREVLMATIPKQALNETIALTAAAGLTLVAAGLSPVSAAEVVLRASPELISDSSHASLIVTRHGPRVEISLLQGRHIVFSHSTQVAGESAAVDNQAVLAAVARSLMGLTGPIQSEDINRVSLLGSPQEFEALAPALETRLNATVQVLDPFGLPQVHAAATLSENGSSYAALVGSLLAQGDALAETIDFLAPRKALVKPDHTRRRVILGAASAACIAALFGGWMSFQVKSLNATIKSLQADEVAADKMLKQGKPILDSAELVGEWADVHTLWLDELVALSKELPPPDRAFLDHVQLDLNAVDARGKMSLVGYSRERLDVEKLSKRFLAQTERFQLQHPTSRPDKKDPFHQWKFDVDVLLKKDAPPVKLTVVVPEKPADDKTSEPAAGAEEKSAGAEKKPAEAEKKPVTEEKKPAEKSAPPPTSPAASSPASTPATTPTPAPASTETEETKTEPADAPTDAKPTDAKEEGGQS